MEYRKHIETNAELSKWYNDKYTEMGDGWNTPAEEINKHLDDLGVPFDKRKTLLDIGCGAGHFIAEAEKRVQCTGIDISAVGCHYARKRAPNSQAWLLSIEKFTSGFQYDYIVSLGSLEHVIDLDKALKNIHSLLADDGMFYFFCPNEKWIHMDQPNERTMRDEEWMKLFAGHGLFTYRVNRWNDSTAFIGSKKLPSPKIEFGNNEHHNFIFDSKGIEISSTGSLFHGDKLNIGSGQRRFDNAEGWINVDCISRPGQVPDVICDVGKEKLPFDSESKTIAVLHQVYEHFGCGEGHELLREICRVLKPGGSLIVTIPDIRALAEKWLTHQIDDYIYVVNLMGAYQGEESDRHKWHYSYSSLCASLMDASPWIRIIPFDWREIRGASIARDFWIMGVEAIK